MARPRKIHPNEKVETEYTRLVGLLAEVPADKLKVADNLIIQASRLKVTLDDLWADIVKNGDIELFKQSEKQQPYERQRPASNLYNERHKMYAGVIKQLVDLLPTGIKTGDDELDQFIKKRIKQ